MRNVKLDLGRQAATPRCSGASCLAPKSEANLASADQFYECNASVDILDRLVHKPHRVEMRGESMCKKRNSPSKKQGMNLFDIEKAGDKGAVECTPNSRRSSSASLRTISPGPPRSTKPNTSCTIITPASLPSDCCSPSLRNTL